MTNVDQTITEITTSFSQDLGSIKNEKDLAALEIKYLGKKGQINTLFKNLTKEEKSKYGQQINKLKNQIATNLKSKIQEQNQNRDDTQFDVTIPGEKPPIGHLHLLTTAIKDIEDIFTKLGFVRRRYPEVDTDWYAAEGLNIPKNHPARDDQETFYIADDVVLTAHTSNGQLREMESVKIPPIKMINIGKTYRRQLDISHTPMFHQFEGLVIDQNINISHLIGISNYFVKNYFDSDSQIRLRPHHFQFTEPSFEVDIVCTSCLGKGCRLCKSGWLELGGAGMVHPQVLKNGGIDPKKYSGFAFGWGIERVIAIKYGLGDIRDLYSTDLRILYQF
jgi:phenylalanyl-tRNA synthetase alpha chain